MFYLSKGIDMKKKFLPLILSAMLPVFASASQNELVLDVLPPLDGQKILSLQEILKAKQDKMFVGQSQADRVQKILVFYQPSYADKYGIDLVHKRIEKSILSDYQKVAGEGRVIEIVDILPLESVSNSLPYENRVDQSGDLVQLGYNYKNTGINGIYNILEVPLDESKYEGQQTLKYQPDLVTIFRERRPDEVSLLGIARLLGVNSLMFDGGSGLSEPDKNNQLTTIVPHELGHNHGLGHELDADETSIGDLGAYTANHAAQCGDAVTLMWSTLSETTEVLGLYSSPDKLHKGEACGYSGDWVSENGAFNQYYYDFYYESFFSKEKLDATSTVSFLESDLSIYESDGKFSFSVVREGDLSLESHVYVRVTDGGTAKYPKDVIDYKKKVFFGVGEGVAQASFTIMQDMLDESSEMLELELVYPFNASESGDKLLVRINNSFISPEDRGEVSLVSSGEPVEEGGVGYIEFERTGGDKGDVLISLRPEYHLFEDTGLSLHKTIVYADYDATEGNDYIMPSTHVVLRDGQRSVKVTVQTLDDYDPEPVEGITLSIDSLSGDELKIEDGLDAALLISDNDAERGGVIAIESDELDVSESGKHIGFEVFRDLNFEGGVYFDLLITTKHAGGDDVVRLSSSFEERSLSLEDLEEFLETGNLAEGMYEAVKLFTYQLPGVYEEYGDYTIEVTVINMINSKFVDPDKSKIVFNVKNDTKSLVSKNIQPKSSEGGSMNIVYLLVTFAVAGFRIRKKLQKKV